MPKLSKAEQKIFDKYKALFDHDDAAWALERDKMTERDELYAGSDKITPFIDRDHKSETPLVRNIVAELIESQVDSSIPAVKVSPVREEDERLAESIEDLCRNQIDRLPTEHINDMAARIIPLQGGCFFLSEWDSTSGDDGEYNLVLLHPRQLVPQDGVTSIRDMSRCGYKYPYTKDAIKERYGVDVSDEAESDPDARSGTDSSTSDDIVTLKVEYYRNSNGGIGRMAWVNDLPLEVNDDYYARRIRRCKKCGMDETIGVVPIDEPTLDGEMPEEGEHKHDDACPYCGSNAWEYVSQGYQEVWTPIQIGDMEIPGAKELLTGTVDETGAEVMEYELVPTKIPFYKPDIIPIAMIPNVSVFGKLLGESDADKIKTHQNVINRVNAKILDILLKAGSYMTVPAKVSVEINPTELKPIPVTNPADMSQFSVLQMEADVSHLENYIEFVYKQAQEAIGITDSYLGRRDTTATSGTAKEFSAAQAAGRMESKRVVKGAGFADIYEMMFKMFLAYADEARPVISDDNRESKYGTFNRYAFLKQDESGEYYWDDDFLFSVDDSSSLAQNRSQMWNETTAQLQMGAYGDPTRVETLIFYWTAMGQLHYPYASKKVAFLRQMQEEQAAAQAAAEEMAAQQMTAQQMADVQAPHQEELAQIINS